MSPQSRPLQHQPPLLAMSDMEESMIYVRYGNDHELQRYQVCIPPEDTSPLSLPINPTISHPQDQPTPTPTSTQDQTYWLIYIHGGYFRDPAILASTFNPTLHHLLTSKDSIRTRALIKGYISIDYRLSASPGSSSSETNRERSSSRGSLSTTNNALWPDHLSDVIKAINHAQNKYGFGEKYVLVGHSVGATMALLSLLLPLADIRERDPAEDMSQIPSQTSPSHSDHISRLVPGLIHPPTAIAGVSGIYSFPVFHQSFPNLLDLTRSVIPRERDWTVASPASHPLEEYRRRWRWSSLAGKGGPRTQRQGHDQHRNKDLAQFERQSTSELKTTGPRYIVLAHSKDDELVDWKQVDTMMNILNPTRTNPSPTGNHDPNQHGIISSPSTATRGEKDDGHDHRIEIKVSLLELRGKHDEIWSQGKELARVCSHAVQMICGID